MTHHRQQRHRPRRPTRRWVILVVLVCLLSSLGCSLSPQRGLARLKRLVGRLEPVVLADRPRDPILATHTPWPTFTPTALPSPTPEPTFTPSATPVPADTLVPSSTPLPTDIPLPAPTATPSPTSPPSPTATPWPLPTVAPARPPATATPAPTPVPTPSYDYLVNEVYIDHTTVPFLTGYIAIVNAQEIPIGGVKAVGVFEPGGQRYESQLSPWFFDVATAPGAVAKIGSVKFEPGGIQPGTWTIHLENEQGDRLSEDLGINTDPEDPQWFYIKFKQPGPARAIASAPTATGPSTTAQSTPTTAQSTPTTASPAVAASGGWSFLGVKSAYDPGREGFFVRGEALNDTGASQRLSKIIGTFYDAGGQMVAGGDEADSYWPIYLVPAGGRVPFEITLHNIQQVADFDLQAITQATNETMRQDFELLDLDSSSDGSDDCVIGKLRNLGDSLASYMVIAAVLYDVQGDVINFDTGTWYPHQVVGDAPLDFEVCVDTLGQDVARYEARAWGQ
jgi:hypothetical protein